MSKVSPTDLAILGGPPSFAEPLHVGAPNIGDRQRLVQRIDRVLDGGRLTNRGPLVREFEREVERLAGVRHCISMCNGTVALEIAVRAAGLSGEVIVPSMTFVATAHALQWQEITPVFCDVDPETLTLDPGLVESMITPRTSGILGVHLWGRPCDVDGLTVVARRHGLRLLFDAAHAFGCSYRGKTIGGFGNAEVFSFHATKCVNAFEGGAVVTDDEELARKIRLMSNFGFAGRDRVIHLGINGKMSEISAAMGLTSLESMDEFVAVNRRNYEQYRDELRGLPGVESLSYDDRERCNYHYVVVQIDERGAGISRDELMEVLHAEGVLARRYFFPGCHRMEPYRSYQPHAGLLLPETERLSRSVLCLPTGTAVTSAQIAEVCNLVRLAIDNAAEVREALAKSRPGRRKEAVTAR